MLVAGVISGALLYIKDDFEVVKESSFLQVPASQCCDLYESEKYVFLGLASGGCGKEGKENVRMCRSYIIPPPELLLISTWK